MRPFILFLIFALLLCGCAASRQETPITDTLPATAQTEVQTGVPATAPLPPPDPMQMLLEAMTVEEKVGQLFLARCPGAAAQDHIRDYALGGFILFGQDFQGQTPQTLAQTLSGYQSCSPIPMLIAVDEEGGSVCRVSANPAFRSSRFPSTRTAYSEGGMELVLTVETEKAALLSSLGINVNMAPVCDIAADPNAFLYDRSLGQGPEETGRFVSSAVTILNNYQLGSVLKHFPGYGNNADTHTGIVRDERSLEALEEWDLKPFAAGIAAGCDAILVSHTIVTALDDQLPASLSPEVHAYLRQNMGFDGVIVTDDLVMQAITDSYGAEEAAILAVLAGNDLLCSTEYPLQYPAVLEAVKSGRISMEQLDASVMRILEWKKDLGLIF